MPSTISLFLLTLVFLLAIFALLVFLKRPVYQITDQNVIRLLELVLAGEASEDDWNVFVDIPIRYNDSLEKVRQRCVEIFDEEADHRLKGHLLSASGLQKLEVLLKELKAGIE